MDIDGTIELSESVFAQEIDGEMVLLDMNSENYFGLDGVAASIWLAMQKNKKLRDIYDSMLEEYEVEPEVLKDDLLDFVQKLSDCGLIQINQ